MSPRELDDLLLRYQGRGTLFDANLLLIFFVGLYRKDLIRQVDGAYDEQAFDLLQRLVVLLGRPVTTPHVLSEINSLTSKRGFRPGFLESFQRTVSMLVEEHVPYTDCIRSPYFVKLGLTDVGIMAICKGRYLVVSSDAELVGALGREGVDALNFNHIRFYPL